MTTKRYRDLADDLRSVIDRWEPKLSHTVADGGVAEILRELGALLDDVGGLPLSDLTAAERWSAVGSWALVYQPYGEDPEGSYYEAIISGYVNRKEGQGRGQLVSLLRPAPSDGGFTTSEASPRKVVLAPDGRRAWGPAGESISPVPPDEMQSNSHEISFDIVRVESLDEILRKAKQLKQGIGR